MTNKTLIIVWLALAFLASCKKPQDSDIQEVEYLLSEVYLNGQIEYAYKYNDNNRLININQFRQGSVTTVESLIYFPDGKLMTRIYEGLYESYNETYNYNENGYLDTLARYYPATRRTYTEIYKYNSGNTISEGDILFNGSFLSNITYEYDDRNNTIKRIEDNSEYRYLYGAVLNPLQLTFPRDIIKNNMPIEYFYQNSTMSYPPPHYTSSFTINSINFPVKEYRSWDTGICDTLTYIYKEMN